MLDAKRRKTVDFSAQYVTSDICYASACMLCNNIFFKGEEVEEKVALLSQFSNTYSRERPVFERETALFVENVISRDKRFALQYSHLYSVIWNQAPTHTHTCTTLSLPKLPSQYIVCQPTQLKSEIGWENACVQECGDKSSLLKSSLHFSVFYSQCCFDLPVKPETSPLVQRFMRAVALVDNLPPLSTNERKINGRKERGLSPPLPRWGLYKWSLSSLYEQK